MTASTLPAVLALQVDPKTADDAMRLRLALPHLLREDESLSAQPGTVAASIVIGGAGERHLEVVVDRLRLEFQVDAWLGAPFVVYRGTVAEAADGETASEDHPGGREARGGMRIRLEPGAPGVGYTFGNEVDDPGIPRAWMRAVDEAVRETLARNTVGGHRVVDVRVRLCQMRKGVDWDEAVVRVAAAGAAEQALRRAGIVLLEPMMRVEAVVPAACLADVTKNLSSRGGEIRVDDESGAMRTIRALVPLAALFGYAVDFRSRTRALGTCTIQFERYRPLPPADDGEGGDALVRIPRKPAPDPRGSRIAVPEPADGRDGYEPTR